MPRTWLLILVLCAGTLQGFLFFSQETTKPLRETKGTIGPTTTTGSIKAKEKKENITLTRVGEEIINVATGIHKFVKDWDATPTTWTTMEPGTKSTEKTQGMEITGKFRDKVLVKGSRGGSRLWATFRV